MDLIKFSGKGDRTMIQSIQAGSTALYNPVSSAAVTGKVSTSKEDTTPAAEQNEDENTATSSQGDTVTISGAGIQAAKTFTGQSANRASETLASEEDTYTDSTAAALSSAAADAGITEYTAAKNQNSANAAAVTGSSSGSSSSSGSNLSEYTESELKEMLENGEITRAEYEAEINSRKQTDETSDDQTEEDADVSAAADTDKTET